MKAKEATDLGLRLAAYVRDDQLARAYELLRPVLRERTPFPTLRRIAGPVGSEPLALANAFLERVAAGGAEGGWVIIGQVLEQQLDRDLSGALARCHRFIVAADVWYGADILGEHVPGPALRELDPWRGDDSAWIRRAVGVAVHHWAKRSRGGREHVDRARGLLAFLEPMFGEWEMAAVKGVGWGLKTLGRYYPELLAEWLAEQRGQRHRALMLRKALTYLSDEQRRLVVGGDVS